MRFRHTRAAQAARAAVTTAAVLTLASVGVSAFAGDLPSEAAGEQGAGPETMPYAVEDFPRTLQVMSWNMCGSQRASWGCDGTGTHEDKIGVVTRNVTVNRVEAALLQEVCEDDLTLLMSRLGTHWSSAFQPYQWSQEGRTTPSRCGEDGTGRADRIGTAILAKGPLGDPKPYPTTQPTTGLNTPFHCATTLTWNVRLCTVHAARLGAEQAHPTWDYRDDQFAQIKNVVDTFPHTVIGGDFNAQSPDTPGNTAAWIWPADLYSTGPGTPGYLECDQTGTTRTGRPTHRSGVKIDYIFGSEPRNWCSVAPTPYSDHHVLVESFDGP
ncbi:endonuclease/exonuclease/phosphatase family protein [Streptomyces roseicoloratus]|uniref:endonuclease/exonuclease/phosphatase family protein n=1 Tax=Streptomyces roseicoloratus TaxID=2508722 RepID=UPI001FE8A6B8|nr:endonuclease/exonuclease/phosphatase family protein [Streptomyces roseicoloratus]